MGKQTITKHGIILAGIGTCLITIIHKLTQARTQTYIRGSLNNFPDFFRMETFIDSTHIKL